MEFVESDLVWMMPLQYCIMEHASPLIMKTVPNTPDCISTSEVKLTVTARLDILASQTETEMETEIVTETS